MHKTILIKKKLPFVYLGNYTKYQLDHVLKQCFRDALHISEDKAHVVVVPPVINAGRTNIKPGSNFEFCLFDIRFRGPWIVGKMPSLLQLLQDRLLESLLWTRTQILYILDDPSLRVVVSKIESGYNYAMTREMIFASAFVESFPPRKNSQMNDSSVGFLLELLLQARKDDLEKMKIYKYEYIQSTKNLISKNFFIRQVVVAADVQIQTSQALCELIKDSSARTNYKRKHEQLTQELEYELLQFKNSYSTNSGFDNVEANFFLKKLSDWKKPNNLLTELLTVQNNQYGYLEKMCNTTLELGNSYEANGQVLDTELGSARDFARELLLPLDYFIERSAREPIEIPLFPQISKLTVDEYDQLIKQQKSEYAKLALKKTHPNAVSEKKYLRDLIVSRSVLDDINAVRGYLKNLKNKDTSEFPNVPETKDTSEFPNVPARKTSDEDRLARLQGNQSPNVPPIQGNQPTNVPPIQNN